MRLTLSVLILSMLPTAAGAKTIYVDHDATGANNGSSWENAYTFLQEALADANQAEKPVEIRVAQGIYQPDQGANQIPGEREATFQLINGVTLKGGYIGLGEPDPNVRDVSLYETILSGDLNGDDVAVADSRDLSDETSREDNSYHVLTGSGTDGTALLDGFTITGGNADASSPNSRGGGMYNQAGSPTITNCTFTANSASWRGAGMHNDNSSPTITNCTFTMNSALYGGGINNYLDSHPTVTNCMLIDNSAGYGGCMHNEYASNPVLSDCTFSGASRFEGGGMRNHDSNPILINCTFVGNSARDGAGMHNDNSSPTITNCTFTGNQAEYGGGMDNEHYSHPVLTNCTFSRNIAEIGNALTCDTYGFTPGKEYPSIVDLGNCILWDGGNEIWNKDGSTINITYSNVLYDQTAIFDPYEAVIWGEGNIHTDPLFLDADGDDNIVGTEDDDLQLSEGSPCIDTGDSSAVPPSVVTDVDGNPRITNSRVDMGAYERPAKYFVFSTRPFLVPEGSTATFTVALVEAPSEAVEVTVAHNSGDQDITVESGGLFSFDTSNYSVPQTFTLSAAEDSDNLNGIARIRISTTNFFADVKVTESDNEPYVGVLFVDDDAAGNNNGSNWTDAYIDLQDALNSSANIGVQEIRIAQGIYRPDQGSGNIPGDRTATFQLINGVVIRGGFAGVGELDPDICDIEIYKTVLGGDLTDNDFDVNEPVVLPYESARDDNSYHVVTGSGTDGTAVLDGVTISSGNANYFSSDHGGGMYNIAGSPTITNCKFIRNWAWVGGGMYNSNSSPTLTNCTFSMNSGFGGGGMYNRNSSNLNLTNCLFTDNSTTIPLGVIVERASDGGGGMRNIRSNSTLANCTFSGNSSTVGGGLYNSESYPILTNCTFTGNSAYQGRAIYDFRSSPSLKNCILWDGGSEIRASSINVTFSNIRGGWEGEGNIDADPLFADPDNGDFHLKSEYGRWDSASDSWVVDDVTSPCIDAGDPNSPVGGECEPNGGIINMGAYGGTEQASMSPFVAETVVYIQWLGHSSVKLWTENCIVYVDPQNLSISPHDATLVCVTHTHGDHYSRSDIAKVSNAQTQFVAPPDVVQRYGSGRTIAPGQTIEFDVVRLVAVPAYNTNKPNHPKSRNWVGYIIELGGKRIYVAGDTDLIDEMKSLGDVNVAILPAGGTYTMNAVEAAEAAQYIKPDLAIPYHWGRNVGTLSDAQRFAELAQCPVTILAVGETTSSDNWPQ
jgi:L-ascorbate metabolism protein UlaG (beta-lactamase superfamily)